MTNLHLFALINAPPGLSPLALALATALAQWVIYLVPIALVIAWVRADRSARRDLLQLLLAAAIALALARVVAHVWPQPRPFALHLGTQYLAHGNDPGMPSDHTTLFWSLALAALGLRRYAVWAFPMLAIGLLVGWSRVYLGVHLPWDILAAFPVALGGALAAKTLRPAVRPVAARLLHLYDGLVRRVRAKLRSAHHA